MKKLLVLLIALAPTITARAQDLTVGSYNIRIDNSRDYKHADGWNQRKQAMCDFINFIAPAALGCQEVKTNQAKDMLQLMPDYGCIGMVNDDSPNEFDFTPTPIFYNKNRLKLLDSGTFWLSEDPSQRKVGWDATYVRMCAWGYFKDLKTKKKFYFFNCHMDHRGKKARQESAKLMMSKMQELMKPGEAVILTGDFNVTEADSVYSFIANSPLLKDSYATAKYRFTPNGSYNDFKVERVMVGNYDHIFLSRRLKVIGFATLNDTDWRAGDDGKKVRHVLSDHYPIFAKIEF